MTAPDSVLRACIIGTGRIASSLEKDPLRPAGCTHAGLYQLHRDAIQLVAGADTDPEALRIFGADWGIPPDQLYADYTAMLATQRPDIASVCAYAPERRAMALAALANGAKGLWLEKAVGCSIADGLAIQAAAQQAGAKVVVDYPRRGRGPFRRIKQIIEEQTFGRLQTVTCHMTHQLIHTGTHAFDVLRYWCGEAVNVSGALEESPTSPHTDSSIRDQGGVATIDFASGTRAFVSARRKRFYVFQFDLMFDNARLLIGNDIAKAYLPAASALYSGFKELFEEPGFDWGLDHPRDMVSELLHCLRTDETPLYSLENAIEALRIALAIFESARRGGEAITPSEVDPELRVESV